MILPSSILVTAAIASFLPVATLAFQLPHSVTAIIAAAPLATTALPMSSTTAASASTTNSDDTSRTHLYVPSERDERYQGDIARYLLDLNNEGATLDFCGGMMFQLVLSDKLKSHLETVKTNQQQQPIVHPASQPLMSRIPNYQKSAHANNISIFHGRELRQIPTANGGMGFVLQLSYADPAGVASTADSDVASAGKGAEAGWDGRPLDPQGWSSAEIATYDGWRGDSFRKWRKGVQYESEGFATFAEEFGSDAFGLNHRFFLHLDGQERMWLSAEDGCEGTPSAGRNIMGKLGGILFGR